MPTVTQTREDVRREKSLQMAVAAVQCGAIKGATASIDIVKVAARFYAFLAAGESEDRD